MTLKNPPPPFICVHFSFRPFARTVVSRGVNKHLTQCRIHSDMRPQKKLCYASPSSPGTIITEKTKECVHPEVSIQNLDTCQPLARQNFSAIIITLQVMDALWLSTSGHVRIQGHRIENEWDLKFVIA